MISKKNENAILDVLREAKAEMLQKQTVANELIEGLNYLKALGGGFHFSKEKTSEGGVLITTSLGTSHLEEYTHIMGDCTIKGVHRIQDPLYISYISVYPDNTINVFGRGMYTKTYDGSEVSEILKEITKLAIADGQALKGTPKKAPLKRSLTLHYSDS